MTNNGYILSFDLGTTSVRSLLVNHDGKIVAISRRAIRQIFPNLGWVEHDPEEIWQAQLQTAREVIANHQIDATEIVAIGITNQRETTVVWDRLTGKPIHNAIVWQCRRTTERCNQLKSQGYDKIITQKTGLLLDAYFSATKLEWILANVPGARERADRGELCFGTVDSWIIYNLTNKRVHATDASNASRTILYNLDTLTWDSELLKLFGVSPLLLPEIMPTSSVFGKTEPELFGAEILIASACGDQQAALFGQQCWQAGMAKNTYGTGCFLLLNAGTERPKDSANMLTTVAWQRQGKTYYALEGSVFVAGAAIEWLQTDLQMISDAAETEVLANSVPDSGGCFFVPAFVGLGAPYWDQDARGMIMGLTRGVTRSHIVRATLEGIAYQATDLVLAMSKATGLCLPQLRVDGGVAKNNFLLQFQADMIATPVERPANAEITALGAAYLAGLATGYWTEEQISQMDQSITAFRPNLAEDDRQKALSAWHRAVEVCRRW